MRGHFGCDSFEFPPHFGPWDRGFGSFGRGRPPFGMMGWPDHHRPSCRPHGPPGFNHSPDLYGMPPPPWPSCGSPLPPHEAHHRRHGILNHERHERRECGSPGPDGQHRSPGCGCHGRPEDHGPRGPCRRSRHSRGPEDCNESSGHHRHQGCERRGPPGPPGDHQGRHHHGPRDNDYDHCDHGYDHHGGHRFGPHNHYHPYGDGRGWSNHFDWRGFGFGPHFGRRDDCHRRPGPNDRPGGCPGRDREECRSGRCCSKNKENEVSNRNKCGGREGDQCGRKNKDKNQTENAVLIQRIVVETAPTRPQSV